MSMSDSEEEEESYMNVAQTGSAQVSDDSTDDRAGWRCLCGACVHSEKNMVCCKSVNEIKATSGLQCITHHADFEPVCLNKAVLFISGMSSSNNQHKTERTNDEYRRIAHSQFAKWIWKQTNVNKALPCCVEKRIESKFPESCSCGHCNQFDLRKLCCKAVTAISSHLANSEVSCITQHHRFRDLCLDKEFIFVSDNTNHQRKTDLKNDDYLRIARRNFVKWIWERTDSNHKLPCCVLDAIWLEFKSESISMSGWLRDGIGTMVIINNEAYENMDERKGSQRDVERLQQLADNLNLQCRVIKDKCYDDIMTSLSFECKNVIKSDLCFICVILSHGGKNHTLLDIKGKKFKLNLIIKAMHKEIRYKDVMKLCFVQACRGNRHVVENKDIFHVKDPAKENFLITYCSVYGHVGYRDIEKGSPFITELCERFNQSHGLEIMQAVTAVKYNMHEYRMLASSTTRLTRELPLVLKTSNVTIPPALYGQHMKKGGLFVIVGQQDKFEEDIRSLQQVAKLWGFDKNNIKTPCSEALSKVHLLNKIVDYVREFGAISCFVCAIISDENASGKFKLNCGNDTFDLKELTTLFRGSDSACDENMSPAKALRGQPKLFFVQKQSSWVETDAIGTNADDFLPHPDADVMITFSKAGFKDKKKATGISAFYDALLQCVRNDQHLEQYDLFKILTKVRREMTDRNHSVPWTQTQLRGEVLFSKYRE